MSKASKRERQRQNRMARREYQEQLEKRRRLWKTARGFLVVVIPVAAVFAFFLIRGSGNDSSSKSSAKSPTVTTLAPKQSLPAPGGVDIDPAKTYTATIETTQGTIVIDLDAKNAPTSVNNFVYLAKAGFYDGLLFNRAAKDFVIQTGGPDNTASGSAGYTVQAELPASAYEVGSVAWAKTGAEPPGTAGSQFFIGTGAQVTSLPKDYGYIGKVTKGLDVAQKIMGYAPASGDGTPTKDVQMTKVTITES